MSDLGETLITLSFFFFLNQQFITWSMRADRGSYFITTYILSSVLIDYMMKSPLELACQDQEK